MENYTVLHTELIHIPDFNVYKYRLYCLYPHKFQGIHFSYLEIGSYNILYAQTGMTMLAFTVDGHTLGVMFGWAASAEQVNIGIGPCSVPGNGRSVFRGPTTIGPLYSTLL